MSKCDNSTTAWCKKGACQYIERYAARNPVYYAEHSFNKYDESQNQLPPLCSGYFSMNYSAFVADEIKTARRRLNSLFHPSDINI